MQAQSALLERPPQASHDRFRALYDREFDYVARTLRRLGARPNDLKDLCQEVFLAAFNRFSTYDPRRPLRPWLFGIAFRAMSDFRYKAYHHREMRTDAPLTLASPPHLDEAVEAREARDLVLASLAALPPERRAVLIMHDLDGSAAPEIADALGVPLNTVYSRLRVARQEFAAAVRRVRPERGQR
jgi:RNA polymerase sigma-70 factor (ECF subfamily)